MSSEAFQAFHSIKILNLPIKNKRQNLLLANASRATLFRPKGHLVLLVKVFLWNILYIEYLLVGYN